MGINDNKICRFCIHWRSHNYRTAGLCTEKIPMVVKVNGVVLTGKWAETIYSEGCSKFKRIDFEEYLYREDLIQQDLARQNRKED